MWSGTLARYLECGVLTHGFARVRCESCKDEFLVAFSCKGRGVCPSFNAKRAHVTAVQWVERVLPHVPYRQWTLSFPHRVRWGLLMDVRLLSDVLTLFLRAGARPAAAEGTAAGPTLLGRPGPCRSSRFFGSALQVTLISTRWCRTAPSCCGRAACTSSRCLRPRKQRWRNC
ncbi:transposase zinc-binding domain-containing protein [Hyalangium gracile]|uniref:transposase zinc-binding domain-containing protein n=1 Tax=Hyalangium gracile TaxID=394092 RepID=UPI001CCD02A8